MNRDIDSNTMNRLADATATYLDACVALGVPLLGVSFSREQYGNARNQFVERVMAGGFSVPGNPLTLRGVPVTLIDPPKCPTCGQEKA